MGSLNQASTSFALEALRCTRIDGEEVWLVSPSIREEHISHVGSFQCGSEPLHWRIKKWVEGRGGGKGPGSQQEKKGRGW